MIRGALQTRMFRACKSLQPPPHRLKEALGAPRMDEGQEHRTRYLGRLERLLGRGNQVPHLSRREQALWNAACDHWQIRCFSAGALQKAY